MMKLIFAAALAIAAAPVSADSEQERCDAYNVEQGGQWCRIVDFEDGPEAVCKSYVCTFEDGCDFWWATLNCPWKQCQDCDD